MIGVLRADNAASIGRTMMGELHRFIQVVLLALMTLGVAGCGGEPTFSPLPPGTVLALGDSVTRGTGTKKPSSECNVANYTQHKD
jgi:hypothetical protein